MKRSFHLFWTIVIVLTAASCTKQDSNNYVSNHRNYFSASFDNYFNPGESGIMIFLSDMSGNLLAEKSLDGLKGTFYVSLYPSTGWQFPQQIIETLVYKGPPSGGKSTIYLYTYLQVLPASWVWTTFSADSTSHTNLEFSGIPAHTAYSIATGSMWINGITLPSTRQVNLGKLPDNAYILLNTADSGYRYKWLTGLVGQNFYQVNLGNMNPTLHKTIPIPPTSTLSYRLNGYLTPGVHNTGIYTLDYADLAGTGPDSITLHFPETVFSDFEFYINTFDPTDTRKQYYEYDFGTIPNRVDRLNGTITVLDSIPDHFSVKTTGGFDRLGSTWMANPLGPYQYLWTVYGSPSSTSFKFPVLPDDLAAQLTGFNPGTLHLSSVEIKDFSGIDNYDDLIKSMFVSGKYIADIVPKYSGLIYYISTDK